MNILSSFKTYLYSSESTVSAISAKNYLSDIQKFRSWYEVTYHEEFSEASLAKGVIERYKKYLTETNHETNSPLSKSEIAPRSGNRYLSSLRKLSAYLLSQKVITTDPFAQDNSNQTQQDPFGLEGFKQYLYTSKIAPLTSKNYILDIKQFFSWLEEISPSGTDILPAIDSLILNEYRDRLVSGGVAIASINRKLSSLRKYTQWAGAKGVFGKSTNLTVDALANNQSDVVDSLREFAQSLESQLPSDQTDHDEDKSGIVFAPIRLMNRVTRILGVLFDSAIVLPIFKLNEAKNYVVWMATGKQIFTSIATNRIRARLQKRNLVSAQFPWEEHISRTTSDPIISTEPLSWYKRMWYIVRHRRPEWYKKYHTYPLVHYVHFAVLMIVMTLFSLIFYNHVSGSGTNGGAVFAEAQAPPRLLSFQGTLKDAEDFPITTPSKVRFTLYSDKTASGTALLWQEVEDVEPSSDGSFTTRLGLRTTLPNTVFTDNSKLYLGITIGTNQELTPRQQIAATSLATNAEKIDGLVPSTLDDAGTKNVLLALDSSGNLQIGGNASPTFQATGGQLSLSGQALYLTTNDGSNTDVVVNPDGSGKIDLQKPLENTSDYSSLLGIQGAVQVDDSFAVNANSSSQPALVINQGDVGPLISASSSGTTKFTLFNDGGAYFAGNIGIGTTSPTTNLEVNGGIKAIGIGIGLEPTSTYSLQAAGIIRAKGLQSEQIRTVDTGLGDTIKLVVNAPASQSANLTEWQVNGSALSVVTNQGNLGLGTTAPREKLDVNGNIAVSGNILLLDGSRTIASRSLTAITLGDDQTGDLLLNPHGNIGIGTTTPHTKAQVTGGSLCVGTDANCATTTNTEGTINANSINNTYFDVAENYPTKDTGLGIGDIAVLDPNTGVFVLKSAGTGAEVALGVISEKPGVRLGGFNGEQYKDDRQVAVGLSGRIPVKVTSQNGPIRIGDQLTLSAIPGTAMKATGAGPVIGTALQDFSDTDPTHVGSILFFIKTGWSDPSVQIARSGDLTIDTTSNNTYTLRNGTNPITTVIAAAEGTIAHLTAGLIQAKTIAADSILIHGQDIQSYIVGLVHETTTSFEGRPIVSPLATIDTIHTHIISPLESDGNVSLTINKDQIAITHDANGSGSAVTTFDNAGNATLSGTLQANSLKSQDASISGTLHAGRIIADQIDGLPQASASSTYVTNVTNVYNSTPTASSPSGTLSNYLAGIANNPAYADSASVSAMLGSTGTLHTSFITADQGLMSLGPTSLSDTSIAGQLAVGGNLILSDNTINTLGAAFEIQPLRQGAINFMGGLIAIDTSGNLTAQGNATFLKDVSVRGTLTASMLSPIPNQDLVIHLGNNDLTDSVLADAGQSLVVTDASGSAVFKVNQKGDVIASGSGMFHDLIAKNLQIVRSVQADTSLTETVATASAGTATILANQTERTIISPYVKASSLIYITPVSNTNGTTPYIARQTAEDQQSGTKGSFTIAIPQSMQVDLKVNWWIVN